MKRVAWLIIMFLAVMAFSVGLVQETITARNCCGKSCCQQKNTCHKTVKVCQCAGQQVTLAIPSTFTALKPVQRDFLVCQSDLSYTYQSVADIFHPPKG